MFFSSSNIDSTTVVTLVNPIECDVDPPYWSDWYIPKRDLLFLSILLPLTVLFTNYPSAIKIIIIIIIIKTVFYFFSFGVS